MESESTVKVENILLGAAKILGCNSATLLMFDEENDRISVKIGTYKKWSPVVKQVEEIFGDMLKNFSISLNAVKDSLIVQAFHKRELIETESVAELLGNSFPQGFVDTLSEIVGEHRFICVPTLGTERMLGVILFEKEDKHPFSLQQRELMLKYARQIGKALDMTIDSTSRGFENMSFTLNGKHMQMMLADSSPALFLGNDFVINLASNMIEMLLGYKPNELVGKQVDAIVPNESELEKLKYSMAPTIAREHVSEEVLHLLHKDGHLIETSALMLYLVDENENPEGCVILLRNPDEYTRRENAFARMLRKERLASMGEIAGQLAHEIRNPLVSIGSIVDMLQRDPEISAEVKEHLHTISKEIARIDGIINDYLSLAANYRLVINEVSISNLVREAIKVAYMHKSAAGKRIELIENAPEIQAKADYNGIKQVLLNLLINALEATPKGKSVRCIIGYEGERIKIVVEDDGIGLPEDRQDLFEPFFTTKEHGTGLGLTVCKRIIEAHGGTIELSTKENGTGTRAEVLLFESPFDSKEYAMRRSVKEER